MDLPTRAPFPCYRGRIDRQTVLTTGQVAALLGVCPRTIVKNFDAGRLKGYRVPNSKDRRIPVASLLAFLREQRIPVPPGLAPPETVLTLGLRPADLAALPGVTAAADAVEFGVLLASPVRAAVVSDDDGLSVARAACRAVRTRHPDAVVVLVVGDDVDPADTAASVTGVHVYRRPVAWGELAACLNLAEGGAA